MKNVDPSSPIFCLTLALFESHAYATKVVPAFTEFKIKYFGHDGVVLHSHEIRKSKGDFKILLNPATRSAFMTDLSTLMALPEYELITILIHKERHAERYQYPADPYELSLGFALERLYEWARGRSGTKVPILAEARGKKEDNALAAEFLRITQDGTNYVSRADFATIDPTLMFITKAENLIGHQIADLAAYAASKFGADPRTSYAPWPIVRARIYPGRSGSYGLKLFP